MAKDRLHRRLTTLDASFLYFEKPAEPMHIGALSVYAGNVSASEVQALLSARLHLLPRYRQRVVFPPLNFAHPTWEDDPDFEISRHVEEVVLSSGDPESLRRVAGELFAGMLDRDRPLWKLLLVRGLDDGSTAMVSKVHHAMVDGMSGVELTVVMHDLKQQAEGPEAPAVSWRPRPLPDPVALLQDAINDRLSENTQAMTDEAFRLLRPSENLERANRMMRAMQSTMGSFFAPQRQIPINGSLSPRRALAWAQFPFAEVRAAKSALGGTVNDLVLTILAGGLGRYLRAEGVSTDDLVLRAMCPVSMRQPDETGQLGNRVSTMIAPLFVGVVDPLERLSREREAMEDLKRTDQAGSFYTLTELGNRVPPAWQAMAGAFSVPNRLFHTVSTNVPGPQIPLYLSGHEMLHWVPLGPLSAGIGLFVAILSYNGALTMGLTADPSLIAEPADLAAHLDAAWAEIRQEAGLAEAPAAKADLGSVPRTPKRPPRRRAAAAAKRR